VLSSAKGRGCGLSASAKKWASTAASIRSVLASLPVAKPRTSLTCLGLLRWPPAPRPGRAPRRRAAGAPLWLRAPPAPHPPYAEKAHQRRADAPLGGWWPPGIARSGGEPRPGGPWPRRCQRSRLAFRSSGCSPPFVALPCRCGLVGGFGGVPGNCSGSVSVRGARRP
jgi:hypothetical protein